MSETKWTPGPWHIFEPLEQGSQHSIGYWIPGKDERYWLVSVYPVRGVPHKFGAAHCDEAEANARLIAAAPDLYEALVKAKDRITELANAGDACWLDWPGAYEIDSALAKADGHK